MGNHENTDKSEKITEVRAYVPTSLVKLFKKEAKKERRKYGEQLARIFEERYQSKES